MAEKKADGGVRSPLFSRAIAAFKRNQEYPILPPAVRRSPPPPSAIRGRFPSDERGIHHPRPEKPLYVLPVRSFRDRKGRKPRISGQSEAIRG